jgi:hypothetical protein
MAKQTVEVVVTALFEEWYAGLDEKTAERVTFTVGLLEQRGVTLGHPYSSAINGSALALRELRVKASGHAIRVFYVFDPARQAVLLVAGDKTGRNTEDFYEEYIRIAEQEYADYLEENE